jgi:hypothetical protein
MTDRDKGLALYRDYQKAYQERFNNYLTPDQLGGVLLALNAGKG